MAIWDNTTKTEKGLALDQKLLTLSKPLKLVAAKSGSGFVNPTQLAKQTELLQLKQDLQLRPAYLSEESTATVPVMLSNAGLTAGYDLFQVGIYAEDPDEGEILYIISQTELESGERVPSAAESPGYSIDWNFAVKVSNAESVEVTVNEAGKLTMDQADARYVKSEMLDKALDEKVDKEEGKGLSTNDYTDSDKAKVQSALQSVPRATATTYGIVKTVNNVNEFWGSEETDAVTVGFYKQAADEIEKMISNKADKPAISYTILSANAWNDKQYSFEDSYPKATYDLSVEPDSTCTEAQLDAWSEARIVGSSAENVIRAYGDVPTINIPVILEVKTK